MIKKISKHGNSFAIVISKAKLKALNIDEDTSLSIAIEGKKIIIEPVAEKKTLKKTTQKEEVGQISADKKMQKLYEKLATKYKPALKKLSKN